MTGTNRRVVITGVGVISPCGLTAEQTFENVTNGVSGIGPITLFDAEAYASQIAGECTGFDPLEYVEKRRLKEGDRLIHLAIGAAQQAVDAAQFRPEGAALDRVGTFIGVGLVGLKTLQDNYRKLLERGPRRVSPYFVPATISNLAPGQISMRFRFRGPSFTTTSACTSGAHAIGEGFKWVQRGGIDAAIVGGSEATVCELGVGGFTAMRALSKRNDDPTRASRPFDTDRDGFVISEGSALMVIEEREMALARGANILAEIVGYGASSDAHHLTQPAPEGEGAQRAMRAAILDAGIEPSAIDYVNAHGTSTPVGDAQELIAIQRVFGEHAKNGLRVSSTKGTTGHLLGAAGGLEGAISAMALSRGVLPPTANLENPDPAAEGMDLIVGEAARGEFEYALSNSFGFGGTNGSLVFRKHS